MLQRLNDVLSNLFFGVADRGHELGDFATVDIISNLTCLVGFRSEFPSSGLAID